MEEGGRVANTICEIGYDAHVILQTGGTEIVQCGGSLAVWTEEAALLKLYLRNQTRLSILPMKELKR